MPKMVRLPRGAAMMTTSITIYNAGNISAFNGRIRRRLPDPDPLCYRNLQIIQQLISDCNDKHSTCGLVKQAGLPSRLIDVQLDNEGETRLVSSAGLCGSTKYAALSHVWGNIQANGPFLTTTEATIDARRHGIDISTMPPNFQDAITVARALGLRYIWIDSICIIQDSFTDWHYEAQRMARVYSNAFITIVATSAASAHEGFLTRQSSFALPTKVPLLTCWIPARARILLPTP
jgi:Heterokaryon incompatibility protein (HET)